MVLLLEVLLLLKFQNSANPLMRGNSLQSPHCQVASHCGSCLVGEEFSKDALPKWIDWRQKKEIVLGFGILDKDLSAQLTEPDCFGGFTPSRLMSSGKLESQRYCASREFEKMSEEAHRVSSPFGILSSICSSYSELLEVLVNKKNVSLEFLDIPHQPQLPPFFFQNPSCHSSKWSQNVQPGDAPVGPIFPLPALLILRMLCVEEDASVLSADTQLTLKCNEVMQAANELVRVRFWL
ncbi:hypothetical protein F0562_027310 [Nyssa sinensis]|uniref:Uncharacterized protein n=1 Tax=Nyssa sinensis TaxID=561372 RepID=A0A5J5B509_9ASTE|nr:hypothetical protein F0562_027310 [Nyssa sinensis]